SIATGAPCAPPPDAPQPVGPLLDAGSRFPELQSDVVYRNGSLWMPHKVGIDFGSRTVSAIRWFQIGVSSWPSAVSVLQVRSLVLTGPGIYIRPSWWMLRTTLLLCSRVSATVSLHQPTLQGVSLPILSIRFDRADSSNKAWPA